MTIASVIKYEGDNQTFVWKYPEEDFNTGSQLIVHESQEAVLFLNGRALDSFGPGRHELVTQNVPLLNKVVNLPTGGDTPFHVEVYFVNLVEQLGIPWGTSSKVQFMEPRYHFPLSIGASGEMGLAVREPRTLLLKVVGTEAALSQSQLIRSIKSYLQTRIKTALAQAISEGQLCIFELDAQLDAISERVRERIAPDLASYGLELTQMLVSTVIKPESDQLYEKFKELYFRQYADIQEAQINQQVSVINQQTRAQETVIEAEALSRKRSLEGYTYQQERGFDVASLMAQNEAVGEFANMGVGLGLMTGIGGTMGSAVDGAVTQAMGDAMGSPATSAVASVGGVSTAGVTAGGGVAAATPVDGSPTTSRGVRLAKFCPNCGYRYEGSERFCPECGEGRELS